MTWLILGAVIMAILAGMVMLGEYMAKQDIEEQTAQEVERIRDQVAEVNREVAGMDAAELDALVYGPEDKTPAPHDAWHATNDIKSKVHWD